MSSPLGRYAAPAAAIASLGIIGAYLFSLLFGSLLTISPAAIDGLKTLALLAAGALFGSAVAVNGYKAPIAALDKRVSQLSTDAAIRHGAGNGNGSAEAEAEA